MLLKCIMGIAASAEMDDTEAQKSDDLDFDRLLFSSSTSYKRNYTVKLDVTVHIDHPPRSRAKSKGQCLQWTRGWGPQPPPN